MLNLEVQCFAGKLLISMIELYLMLGGRAAEMNSLYSFVVSVNFENDSSPASGLGYNLRLLVI